jgi:transposase
MFIKQINKKNNDGTKQYIQHRLVESYRTEKGPRQRTILNLGTLSLPKEHWKLLADQIEAELTGQQQLYEIDADIKALAVHYARIIVNKQLLRPRVAEAEHPGVDYETIDINSLSDSKCRTVGAEYVGLATFNKLGLDRLFSQLGFSKDQIKLAALAIVGKLVYPGSEWRTRRWAKHLSGIDELLTTDFRYLSNNMLYRMSDLLLSHQEVIEQHLAQREKDLFSLEEKIILYDLTNTYFEGQAKGNRKARHGRSKDKRNDCPLLTLGLVIDELGFPKLSKIFQGNISEPQTLKHILEQLQGKGIVPSQSSANQRKHRTVVVDAGIVSEANLSFLKAEGYDYIVVARNKPIDLSELNSDDMLTIKQDNRNEVQAQLIKADGEQILYCQSFLKQQKEQSMKQLFQQRFEHDLNMVAAAVTKKGGTKKYEKVLQRIGRLQNKYASIAQYYAIHVHSNDNKIATKVEWSFVKQQQAEQRFSGGYFLRTSRTDLDEREIWDLYIMLTNLEDAFRSLKTELKLRPIHHQKEPRSDAHLFITVLAYHLLNTIQTQLKQHGIHKQWWNIRELLSSHVRVTTSMTTQDGRRIHLRKSTEAEPFHRMIYDALQLSYYPLRMKRVEF